MSKGQTSNIVYCKLEFNVKKGFWAASALGDRRALGGVVVKLADFGYECFWQAQRRLVPVSGECWSVWLERTGWSNLLCAHHRQVVRFLHDEASARTITELVDDLIAHLGPEAAIKAATKRGEALSLEWLRRRINISAPKSAATW